MTAQGHAVHGWWNGYDPAGEQAATITSPTLIADGTSDRLDALAAHPVIRSRSSSPASVSLATTST